MVVGVGTEDHQAGVRPDRPTPQGNGRPANRHTRPRREAQVTAGESRAGHLTGRPEVLDGPFTTRQLLRLGVSLRFSRSFQAEVRHAQMRGRFLDDANRVSMPDARLTDLRLAKSMGRVQARLDVLNLTNRRYEEVGYVLPDPARRTEVPYVFPGPGRAVRLSLHWTR